MKKEKIGMLVATLFVGKWMKFMGTAGSVISLPICWAAVSLFYATGRLGWALYGLILIFILAIGVWTVPMAERELGPMIDPFGKVREHDHNQISIDETLGMLVASLPLLWNTPSLLMYGAVLVVFRVFDILKPWPIKYFDKMQSAWGVMMDDAVAGMYAAIVIGIFGLIF